MNRHTFKRGLFGLLTIALLAVALPTVVLAQTDGEPPARDQPVLTEQERTDRLAEVKARATEQIEKRLGALERLSGKIEGAKYLEDGHGASLLSDISAATAVLRSGLANVAAAETIEELHEVVPPIFESTLVFALLGPKTHEVIASGATSGIAARFTENGTKLQNALDRLAETGVDVAGAQESLDEAARLVVNAGRDGWGSRRLRHQLTARGLAGAGPGRTGRGQSHSRGSPHLAERGPCTGQGRHRVHPGPNPTTRRLAIVSAFRPAQDNHPPPAPGSVVHYAAAMDKSSRIRHNFEQDGYAVSLGMRLIEDNPETVVVELPVADAHLNFHGSTHGGALFSVADCAFSLISNAAGPVAVAIDAHLVISAATSAGDTLRAEATEVRRGRQLATYQVRVTRDDARLCGLFTGTVFIQD